MIHHVSGSTNASDPSSSKIRRSRGKFKGLETLKKMRGYNNAKLHVQIDMEFRRPFGENTDDLVGEIARLVTLCASFDVPYWCDVPEDRKIKIYEKLLDKFELKVRDEVCNDIHIRKIIYEIAGRRYRDVRSTLYPHYQSYATDEDRLQNPPEDVNANEWAWLVNYFGSQKFKAMSERNKVNHSKQVISHITRRKSFKQVSWAEETVKDKLEEIASQPCDSPVASTPEEVLSLVVGQRSGHVRGRGCGPKPPFKSAATIAKIAGLETQVKDKDERISQMEELISQQKEEVAQIQEQLCKQKAEVTARLQSNMSSQLNELVNKKFMDMMFQFHRDLGIGH
ncbi:hypothetical protein Taro_006405 [Colocasia esculenta]|uniref:Transposase, Ptta/En/Spm, plant n=1 Tax=Colocasia esculenta TaxID=4460 RepID=A0A843TVW4_COLES|nr:hypothetical protein [Colocasia esculenta]